MTVRLLTWAERPGLAARGPRSEAVWPEYNLHGDVDQQHTATGYLRP